MTTMDLIDRFAEAALTGMLAREGCASESVGHAARRAYEYAEAMAAERERVVERRRASARTRTVATSGLTPGGTCRDFTQDD